VPEGDTREDALANAREAISLFLEDMLADGEEMSEELARPELAEGDVSITSEVNGAHETRAVASVNR
jgi:predicted RNase H-like HicB family nuclease